MKQISFFFIAMLFSVSAMAQSKKAPKSYTDTFGRRVMVGNLTRSMLEQDTVHFGWFKENMRYGRPDAAAVDAFKQKKNSFKILVVMGTWCKDSRSIIPALFRLVDKSEFPQNKIRLVGASEDKLNPSKLIAKYNITRVPTILILHKGKEWGRVEEYGNEGQIDKELGQIVARLPQ